MIGGGPIPHIRIYYDLPGIGDTDVKVYKFGNSWTISTLDIDTQEEWEAAPRDGFICANVKNLAREDANASWTVAWYSPATERVECPACAWKPQGAEFYFKGPEDVDCHGTAALGPFLSKVGILADGQMPTDAHIQEGMDRGWVKRGRYCDQQKWEAIFDHAAKDADFPKVSPRRRGTDAT